jgi:hypothetical protein
MRRLHTIWLCTLLVALLCATSGRAAPAQSGCSQPACIYLPAVFVPPPAHVTEVYFTRDRSGNILAQGEVINTTANPLYDVVVEARLYDETNQLIRTVSGTTVLSATLPGQVSPFNFYTGLSIGEPPYAARIEASIIEWNESSPQTYRPATVVQVRTETDIPDVSVKVYADIRNDESVSLTNVRVVAWSFPQNGRNIPVTVPGQLMPGATTTITTWVTYGYDNNAIKIVAQGIAAP